MGSFAIQGNNNLRIFFYFSFTDRDGGDSKKVRWGFGGIVKVIKVSWKWEEMYMLFAKSYPG